MKNLLVLPMFTVLVYMDKVNFLIVNSLNSSFQMNHMGFYNVYLGKIGAEQLMGKLTRSHVGPGGKESHQCLICSKWYAVPPLKHMRSHLLTFKYVDTCTRVSITYFDYRY